VVSYNALLSSAAASAAWKGALEVMQRMATEDQEMGGMDGDLGYVYYNCSICTVILVHGYHNIYSIYIIILYTNIYCIYYYIHVH
jgi:hypothetical protein